MAAPILEQFSNMVGQLWLGGKIALNKNMFQNSLEWSLKHMSEARTLILL